MGESQQVQSLDAAVTNVIFIPSKLLAPEKLAWKCLIECGGFLLLFFFLKIKKKKKFSFY